MIIKSELNEKLDGYNKIGICNAICSSLDIPLLNYHEYITSVISHSKDTKELTEITMKRYIWI